MQQLQYIITLFKSNIYVMLVVYNSLRDSWTLNSNVDLMLI